jgi:D-alanyl-D-alanine carboxypeptidase
MDQVVTNKRVPSVVAGGLQDGERWSYATGTASFEVPRPVEPAHNKIINKEFGR